MVPKKFGNKMNDASVGYDDINNKKEIHLYGTNESMDENVYITIDLSVNQYTGIFYQTEVLFLQQSKSLNCARKICAKSIVDVRDNVKKCLSWECVEDGKSYSDLVPRIDCNTITPESDLIE